MKRCSNALVAVAAPDHDVRFVASYERVASRTENYISWALARLSITSPLNPRLKTFLVYPKPK